MNEPTFRPDGFWRGDVWPPTNYLIALGLDRYGYYDLAREMADKMLELVRKHDGHAHERYNGVEGRGLGVKDYCWGVANWSMLVNTRYGVQEDYRTIVVPPHAKGRKLKLGKLEVAFPTDTSVELNRFPAGIQGCFSRQNECGDPGSVRRGNDKIRQPSRHAI